MEPLASCVVKVNGSLGDKSCNIFRLNENHLSQIAKLQEQVVAGLADKRFLFPLSHEEMANVLSPKGGLSVGAFVGEELIGFRCLYFPGKQRDNLGKDVGLPKEALEQVVHLEAAFVHQDFQGNSLQKRLTGLALRQLEMLSWPRYLMATVMPANIPSIVDKFAQSLEIVDLKEKYGAGWRYIFFRDLQVNSSVQDKKIISTAVDITDLPTQLSLIAKGYRGMGLGKNGDRLILLFGT